ncbi:MULTISPECIES: GNAT family N-acetyltransferase [Clostridium]|uniref:GNAT family N-acetyltransferase n=1 Tax=Clostridium TaxID=1485 RepID=UPI000824D63F|nr:MULTISPECIES: GNAT family N-acetyltransferase [Clostridium]PJI08222.1 N-acetyltransferase [Clostridium sp. CT7]
MDISIRQVSLEDLDRVSEIEEICFPEKEAASRESLKKRIITFPQTFFVAEKDEEIIGFINGCVTNATSIYDEMYEDSSLHILDGDYQAIFGLDVMPDYRKQGVGAQLMNYMIKMAKVAGRNGIILTCKKKLIHYYSKFGYVNKGTSKSVHGGATWYDMILKF